jgi:hypothetical protein
LTYFLAKKSKGIQKVKSNHTDSATILNGGIMKCLNGNRIGPFAATTNGNLIVASNHRDNDTTMNRGLMARPQQERRVTFHKKHTTYTDCLPLVDEATENDHELLILYCQMSKKGKCIRRMLRKHSPLLDDFCQRPAMKSMLSFESNLSDLQLVYNRFKSNSFTYLLIVGCMSVYDNSSRIYLIADLSLRMCFECIEDICTVDDVVEVVVEDDDEAEAEAKRREKVIFAELRTEIRKKMLTEKFLIAILCRCFSNCLLGLLPLATDRYPEESVFLRAFKGGMCQNDNTATDSEINTINHKLGRGFEWV